jgi:hypothetical protein
MLPRDTRLKTPSSMRLHTVDIATELELGLTAANHRQLYRAQRSETEDLQ